jgi:GNAT superfamily N-acetyltransferase
LLDVVVEKERGDGFCHTTAAIAADGRLAAYTQMGGASANPERLYQWDTFVWPEHRGRGLGMAVKIPNLQSLQAELDHRAVLHTWNAPENAPMIRVNDQLGFRAVDRRTNWERAV